VATKEQPPLDDADALLKYLWAFDSHARPFMLYEWFDECVITNETLAALLPDVWVDRNEKMRGDMRPGWWEVMFDEAWVGSGGLTFPVTVYRAGHPDGMAWTVDLAVAEKFALRGRVIHTVTITNPGEVLAVFHDRDESEVVLRPGAWARSSERSTTGE
jgi:hypothetical protein